MTRAERKLAAVMLEMASEEFGNHSCNEFDLVKDGELTAAESFEIRKAMHAWNGDPGEEKPRKLDHMTMDSIVMSYLAQKLSDEDQLKRDDADK